MTFKEEISQGIPLNLPEHPGFEAQVNHAPKRKAILSDSEKKLALQILIFLLVN